mmetsp:Transcript_18200/g.56311  ORF Transcript_18200/g.56311 Transcript_18200/m.56311 type:complete len:213 (+) Transcript_18200:264-902(+)
MLHDIPGAIKRHSLADFTNCPPLDGGGIGHLHLPTLPQGNPVHQGARPRDRAGASLPHPDGDRRVGDVALGAQREGEPVEVLGRVALASEHLEDRCVDGPRRLHDGVERGPELRARPWWLHGCRMLQDLGGHWHVVVVRQRLRAGAGELGHAPLEALQVAAVRGVVQQHLLAEPPRRLLDVAVAWHCARFNESHVEAFWHCVVDEHAVERFA